MGTEDRARSSPTLDDRSLDEALADFVLEALTADTGQLEALTASRAAEVLERRVLR